MQKNVKIGQYIKIDTEQLDLTMLWGYSNTDISNEVLLILLDEYGDDIDEEPLL